jgi:copper oxidase (laccase) domain-containing protein
VEILRAQLLTQLPWLIHGFSTRQGGVSTCYGGGTLNLSLTQQDKPENVERNRVLFLQADKASYPTMAPLDQYLMPDGSSEIALARLVDE